MRMGHFYLYLFLLHSISSSSITSYINSDTNCTKPTNNSTACVYTKQADNTDVVILEYKKNVKMELTVLDAKSVEIVSTTGYSKINITNSSDVFSAYNNTGNSCEKCKLILLDSKATRIMEPLSHFKSSNSVIDYLLLTNVAELDIVDESVIRHLQATVTALSPTIKSSSVYSLDLDARGSSRVKIFNSTIRQVKRLHCSSNVLVDLTTFEEIAEQSVRITKGEMTVKNSMIKSFQVESFIVTNGNLTFDNVTFDPEPEIVLMEANGIGNFILRSYTLNGSYQYEVTFKNKDVIFFPFSALNVKLNSTIYLLIILGGVCAILATFLIIALTLKPHRCAKKNTGKIIHCDMDNKKVIERDNSESSAIANHYNIPEKKSVNINSTNTKHEIGTTPKNRDEKTVSFDKESNDANSLKLLSEGLTFRKLSKKEDDVYHDAKSSNFRVINPIKRVDAEGNALPFGPKSSHYKELNSTQTSIKPGTNETVNNCDDAELGDYTDVDIRNQSSGIHSQNRSKIEDCCYETQLNSSVAVARGRTVDDNRLEPAQGKLKPVVPPGSKSPFEKYLSSTSPHKQSPNWKAAEDFDYGDGDYNEVETRDPVPGHVTQNIPLIQEDEYNENQVNNSVSALKEGLLNRFRLDSAPDKFKPFVPKMSKSLFNEQPLRMNSSSTNTNIADLSDDDNGEGIYESFTGY